MSLFDDIDDIFSDNNVLDDKDIKMNSQLYNDPFPTLRQTMDKSVFYDDKDLVFHAIESELRNAYVYNACFFPRPKSNKYRLFSRIKIDKKKKPTYEDHNILKLGEYIPGKREIILYQKNIDSSEEGKDLPNILYFTTFIHECMHALFDVPNHGSIGLPFIEEPIAEAGMLNFIKKHCEQEQYEKCLKIVENKKGALAHYGFGATLHKKSCEKRVLMVEVYQKICATCNQQEVKKTIEKSPEYKDYVKAVFANKHVKAYECLKNIIFNVYDSYNLSH